MFGWCMDNKHEQCRRKMRKWHWDAKMKEIVWEDEYSYCDCKARHCPCSKNDTAPVAPVTRKRKK